MHEPRIWFAVCSSGEIARVTEHPAEEAITQCAVSTWLDLVVEHVAEARFAFALALRRIYPMWCVVWCGVVCGVEWCVRGEREYNHLLLNPLTPRLLLLATYHSSRNAHCPSLTAHYPLRTAQHVGHY